MFLLPLNGESLDGSYNLYTSSVFPYVFSFIYVLLSHLRNTINSIKMERNKQKFYSQTTVWSSSKDRRNMPYSATCRCPGVPWTCLSGKAEVRRGDFRSGHGGQGRFHWAPLWVCRRSWSPHYGRHQAQVGHLATAAATNTRSAQHWSPHFLPCTAIL